jgi:hypothetical protein
VAYYWADRIWRIGADACIECSQQQTAAVTRSPLLLRGRILPAGLMLADLIYSYNMFMTITDLINYYLSVPRSTALG